MSLINLCSHERLEVRPIKHIRGTITDFQVHIIRSEQIISVLFLNSFEVRVIDDKEDLHGSEPTQ